MSTTWKAILILVGIVVLIWLVALVVILGTTAGEAAITPISS
jgi:hypothetical protein